MTWSSRGSVHDDPRSRALAGYRVGAVAGPVRGGVVMRTMLTAWVIGFLAITTSVDDAWVTEPSLTIEHGTVGAVGWGLGDIILGA